MQLPFSDCELDELTLPDGELIYALRSLVFDEGHGIISPRWEQFAAFEFMDGDNGMGHLRGLLPYEEYNRLVDCIGCRLRDLFRTQGNGRAQLVSLLDKLGAAVPAYRDLIESALGDASADVRIEAVRALADHAAGLAAQLHTARGAPAPVVCVRVGGWCGHTRPAAAHVTHRAAAAGHGDRAAARLPQRRGVPAPRRGARADGQDHPAWPRDFDGRGHLPRARRERR